MVNCLVIGAPTGPATDSNTASTCQPKAKPTPSTTQEASLDPLEIRINEVGFGKMASLNYTAILFMLIWKILVPR